MGLTLRHPDVDDMIGDYKVVAFLGAGGLGIVYKVERGGRFFALKLLLVPELDGRAKREIVILVHLENPCVVRYVGSDFWPDPVNGHPYIVMEFVPGDTLWTFAYTHNPSARKATRIILDVALTLGEVHSAGVFHRDVKPENIIIRGASERPILIDFGIGSLASAPTVTGSQLPPGTEEFRSPEQIRFQRAHEDDGAQYEFGPADELWALGVTYYWLLTDALPFGERTDKGGLDGLRERILTHRPDAPHVVNPCVPLAASLLCMKMLAELPEDRLLVAPLCAALRETLSNAENAPAWDAPLGDPNDPQLTTTVEDPDQGGLSETRRAFLRATKQRPRRGRPLPKRERVFFLPPPVAGPQPPAAVGHPDESPAVEAPGESPPPGDEAPPVVDALLPPAREQLGSPVTPSPRRVAWGVGVAAVVLTGAVVALSIGADLWESRVSDVTSGEQPTTSAESHATDGGVIGREMAVALKLPDSQSGGDAAPERDQPPASTDNAMPRTRAQKTKKEETKPQAGSSAPIAAVIAACSLLDGGCTTTGSQVRPEPPAISCPQGWKDTHERYSIGYAGMATVKGSKGAQGEWIRVRDGAASLQVGVFGGVGGLPDGTLLLGTWQLGDDRVFGTFTRAQIPGAGTLPLCLVAGHEVDTAYTDEHGKPFTCPPGLGLCLSPGSKPGNAKTRTRVDLVRPSQQP